MTIGPELIDAIKAIAGLISALGIIFGGIFAIYRFVLRQKQQDEELKQLNERFDREIKELKEEQNAQIKAIKEEQTLLCYGVMACLDGLEQQGCNHTVPIAKSKFEKHLNIEAHR